MKKLLLFVIACTLGLFTVNAQDNRLESITKTNEGENITYVYEDGTNKVIEVREGVYNAEYGSQYAKLLSYDENGLLVKSERVFLWEDAPDYSGEWTINNYNYGIF